MKTPLEIEREIEVLSGSLPLLPRKPIHGDFFIIHTEGFNRIFGVSSSDLYEVTNMTRSGFTAKVVYNCASKKNDYGVGFVQERTFTNKEIKEFKRGIKLCSTGFSTVDRLRELLAEKELAASHALNSVKRWRDVYVLWNTIYEEAATLQGRSREGFLIEVYDGNGKLKERVRMMAEDCFEQSDRIEYMVRAYASGYFDHDDVKSGSVFRFQFVWQMD